MIVIPDRVLIRMPDSLELFLAATSVVHNYVVQQTRQILQGQKQAEGFRVTVELGHEEQFFFLPLFPHLNITLRGWPQLKRQNWECVLDMRTTDRAFNLAQAQQKHLTEMWGVLYGASPGKVPELGTMKAKLGQPPFDILIDEEMECAWVLRRFFESNYPDLLVRLKKVNGQRAFQIFEDIQNTRMYIGKRSAATYLTAMMGKKLVELYPNDWPLWFLSKDKNDSYRVLYGDTFTPEMVWCECTELVEEAQWTSCNMTYRGGIKRSSLSTVEAAVGR